ncbi:hypothetical protein CEP54_009428 [Fusarium duplospermum]|uniref:Uncharacterized protein n=1 Tax=Fusarium duplospermum TaxID=1325734 RepID=A0A428PR03_9HYPO|nr:hypothetical protein CEP54_009428 [Fusarium duplospermum]
MTGSYAKHWTDNGSIVTIDDMPINADVFEWVSQLRAQLLRARDETRSLMPHEESDSPPIGLISSNQILLQTFYNYNTVNPSKRRIVFPSNYFHTKLPDSFCNMATHRDQSPSAFFLSPLGIYDGGFYSHAVTVNRPGRLVWTSGIIGKRPDGSLPDDFIEQVDLAIDNLLLTLNAAGATGRDLIQVNMYAVDWK